MTIYAKSSSKFRKQDVSQFIPWGQWYTITKLYHLFVRKKYPQKTEKSLWSPRRQLMFKHPMFYFLIVTQVSSRPNDCHILLLWLFSFPLPGVTCSPLNPSATIHMKGFSQNTKLGSHGPPLLWLWSTLHDLTCRCPSMSQTHKPTFSLLKHRSHVHTCRSELLCSFFPAPEIVICSIHTTTSSSDYPQPISFRYQFFHELFPTTLLQTTSGSGAFNARTDHVATT